MGRKAGLSDDKLRAVLSDNRTSFNDTERLVIELADAMTDTPANVSDDLYARLRKQFSEEQLMQLGAQIAFENYRARWNRIFNVESDNLYTPQPNKSQESHQPECADVSPASRSVFRLRQFCNPAILPPVPVICEGSHRAASLRFPQRSALAFVLTQLLARSRPAVVPPSHRIDSATGPDS